MDRQHNEVKLQEGLRREEVRSESRVLLDRRYSRSSHGKTGHWSDKENVKYYAFLKRFMDKFSEKEKRREWKVFKNLAEFVKTRNPNQCRSHHHKMQKDFRTVEDTLDYLKEKIPEIDQKSKKYEQILKRITFVNSPFEQEYQRQKQLMALEEEKQRERKKRQINVTRENNEIPYEKQRKKEGIEFIRTNDTYEDVEEKRVVDFGQSSYMNNIPFNQSLMGNSPFCFMGIKNYNTEYRMNQDSYNKQIEECQTYFFKWWNKLNELMEREKCQEQ